MIDFTGAEIMPKKDRNLVIHFFCYREKEMISGRNISEKSVVTGLLAMTAAAILLTYPTTTTT